MAFLTPNVRAGFGWNKHEDAVTNQCATPYKPANDDIDPGIDGNLDAVTDLPRREPSGRIKGRIMKKSNRSGGPRGAHNAPIDLSDESSEGSIRSSNEKDDDDDDDASVIDITPSVPRKKANKNFDRDLPYPIYWTEIISPITNDAYPVDSLVISHAVSTSAEDIAQFEPRGAKAEKAKQILAYVVAHSADGTAKDVTTRYLKRHMWPGRTKGVRMPVEKIPVYNKWGKIKHFEIYDWFKAVMSGYARTHVMRTAVDDLEEAKDLRPVKPEKKEAKVSDETLQGYKDSAEYVLERHLRREEALVPGAEPVKSFTTGKGDKVREEWVYRRTDVEICRTSESWHKGGRAVIAGAHPLKMVPIRAVTLTRKREVEEAERDGGEKLKQGLYAEHQTDWIIPPPIEKGMIPKNAYGNMDCYVPSMVPKGAVHIPLRGTRRICKRLGFDFAEAVTGFEFGNKRAVPVVTGVVIAEENEHAVIDEWEKDEKERLVKEEGKREKMALAMWHKWLMGLRIVRRVREEYGGEADEHMKEELNPFTNQNKAKKSAPSEPQIDAQHTKKRLDTIKDDAPAGFLADDGASDVEGGGFLPEGNEEEPCQALVIEDGADASKEHAINHTLRVEREFVNGHSPVNHAESDKPSDEACPSHSASGMGSSKNTSKPKRGRPPKRDSVNGSKRKASSTSTGTDFDDVEPKRRTRKAARKSASALKSHYFDHSSDDGSDPRNVESPAEDDMTTKPVRGRKAAAPAATARSPTRRKHA